MLTERDAEIVRQLDRTGGMTARQVALAFGLTMASPEPTAAAREADELRAKKARAAGRKYEPKPLGSTGEKIATRRLAELGRMRFAEPAKPYGPGSEALWIPTRAGMREILADDENAPPSIMAATYKHQYALGEVYGLLMRANVYHLTEREIRRRQNAEEHRDFSLSTGGESWHQPDGLIYPTASHAAAQTPIAIELERSRKGGTRLRRIMELYRAHAQIAHVVYICTPETLTSTTNVVAGKPARKLDPPKTALTDTVSIAVLRDIHTWLPDFLREQGTPTDLRLGPDDTARVRAAMARYF